MSLSVTFKKCISPNEKFDKAFASGDATFSVALKEKTDIFRPTFILQTSTFLGNFNYIDGSSSFGRKYFITDIRSIGNERYEVDAKTDVLSTWASEIRTNSAVIKRQEKLYNLYLDDPDFHVLNYERIQTKQFPTSNSANGFMKSLQYVLVTNGAGTTNRDFSQLKGGESDGTESGILVSEQTDAL